MARTQTATPRVGTRNFSFSTFFTGAGMQIQVADIGSILNVKTATPPSFTMAYWINPSVPQQDLSGIGLMSSSCRLALRATLIPFFQIKAGSSLCTGTTPLLPRRWTHIAGTFNSTTNRMSLYINGVLNQTNVAADVDLSALTRSFIMSGTNGNFSGYLKEVIVSNYLAVAADIANLYYGDIILPNLVTYHKMNEGTGTTVADSSGNGFTGTFNGAVAWATSVPTNIRTTSTARTVAGTRTLVT